jgi:hypothetical protein
MAKASNKLEVYLEIGKKRTFAGALDWPGWSRSGHDEASALQALLDYGQRYARILPKSLKFHPPTDVSAFTVVERLEGNATTDFGAPDITPLSDKRPVDEAELKRLQTLLKAYWKAFDAAVLSASRKELRKGPRGGGREVEGIIQHVLGAEGGYLSRLGWKFKRNEAGDLDEELARTRQAVLEGLAAAAHGETPKQGPRGGIIWTPRYFVRRDAWHVLDHLWEIEDRIIE